MSNTGIVPIGSDLERKRWIREGMIQAASKSFWGAYSGTSKDSIVYVVNNERADAGHTVVFDLDGNISGKAIKGKNRAYGKGETKRKFSDKVSIDRYRIPVANGDKFDGKNIGDLSINEHSDSRRKLGDLWIRWKDQGLFDAAQGNLDTQDEGRQVATHSIDLGATFNWNTLIDIETTLRTSQGYSTGGIRRPLDLYEFNGGMPLWTMMIDSNMAAKLKKDVQGYQAVLKDADFRGNNNRLVKGYIGRIGALVIVEAPNFFGATLSEGGNTGWGLDDSEVELCGLRQFDKDNDAWTGEEGFDYAAQLQSTGVILGAGGLQLAMGMMPDYKFQESEDFAITSESALEVWCEMRKAKYKLESGKDYKQAKVSGIDHGIVTVTLDL